MKTPNFQMIKTILIYWILLFVDGQIPVAEDEAECKSGLMKCKLSSKCIPLSWKCDGDADCDDMSDEENCPPKTCADAEHLCDTNGTCIPERWKCDGETDCPGGEDENAIICADIPGCGIDEFRCGDGLCISNNWKCDGVEDCSDGVDEKNCHQDCPAENFLCSDGKQCIATAWVCDRDKDCTDGSDENNCPEIDGCPPDKFMCNSTRKCIDLGWFCDGDFDCQDHSDENNANCTRDIIDDGSMETCDPESDFHCKTGECIHISWKCDGNIDCEDGSDEDEDFCIEPTFPIRLVIPDNCLTGYELIGPTGKQVLILSPTVRLHARGLSLSGGCGDLTTSSPCVVSGIVFESGEYLLKPLSGTEYNENCSVSVNVENDECASSPCQNGATCNDGINQYTCTCREGWTGTHCEIDIDECASSPCQNGATCNDGINQYTCTCREGWTGTHCQIDIDECASSPCQNGATCNDGINQYTCTCREGWTATHCQIDIDECASSPCQNGATCNDGINQYTCTCGDGWTGRHCQIDKDECASSPCQNGATCNDGINQYTCTCGEGWNGTHCQIAAANCPSGDFQCANTSLGRIMECIDKRLRCDSYVDCSDGSDELDCHELLPVYVITAVFGAVLLTALITTIVYCLKVRSKTKSVVDPDSREDGLPVQNAEYMEMEVLNTETGSNNIETDVNDIYAEIADDNVRDIDMTKASNGSKNFYLTEIENDRRPQLQDTHKGVGKDIDRTRSLNGLDSPEDNRRSQLDLHNTHNEFEASGICIAAAYADAGTQEIKEDTYEALQNQKRETDDGVYSQSCIKRPHRI